MPFLGRARSPSNTMYLHSSFSFAFIHPTVWPQYTNVTDRQERQTGQRSDSTGQTVLQMVAQKPCAAAAAMRPLSNSFDHLLVFAISFEYPVSMLQKHFRSKVYVRRHMPIGQVKNDQRSVNFSCHRRISVVKLWRIWAIYFVTFCTENVSKYYGGTGLSDYHVPPIRGAYLIC